MDVKVYPSRLAGEIRAVDSKSAAHRAIFAAALCQRPPELTIRDSSDDIRASLGAARAIREGRGEIDCAECGATLRFALPVAAALGRTARFTGRGRLPERPIAPLVRALAAHGCAFSAERLPFELRGQLASGVFELPGNISSQFVSGLLLALPALPGGGEIRLTSPLESAGYVDLTRAVLADFGIAVEETSAGYRVPGGQTFAPPPTYAPEGDWSSAAFFLAANALGGSVRVTGLRQDSLQPDRQIAALMASLADLDAAKAPGPCAHHGGGVRDHAGALAHSKRRAPARQGERPAHRAGRLPQGNRRGRARGRRRDGDSRPGPPCPAARRTRAATTGWPWRWPSRPARRKIPSPSWARRR